MRTNIVKHWGKHIFMDPVDWVPPKMLRTLGQYEWVYGIMKHEVEGALMFKFLGDGVIDDKVKAKRWYVPANSNPASVGSQEIYSPIWPETYLHAIVGKPR